MIVSFNSYDSQKKATKDFPTIDFNKKTYDKERGSAKSRGYNSRWTKVREIFISANPFCVMCNAEGNEHVLGEEVDHIKEIKDGGEMYNFRNLQTLCKRHHRLKTLEVKRAREKNKLNPCYEKVITQKAKTNPQ